MAKLAKKYNSKNYVYDSLFVGVISSNGFIYWHYRKNGKYFTKTKII